MPAVTRHRYMPRNFYNWAAFDPSQLPNLVAWYDASDTATITQSAGAVSQWNDKSASGFHLTQATGTNQPITGTRTVNGLNVLDFDGTNDFMSNANTIAQPFSMWAVFQFDTTAPSRQVVLGQQSGNVGICIETGNFNTLWVVGDWNDGIQFGTIDTSVHLLGGNINGASSLANLDGGADQTGTVTSGSLALNAVTSAGDAIMNGVICEIIVCSSALGSTDRASIHTYAQSKWGTP